jgi:hypothetical protein
MSDRIIILSIFVLLGGLSTIIATFVDDSSQWYLVSGFLYIVLAIALYLPTDNFKKIVTTEGNDIAELGRAFKELGRGMIAVNLFTALNVIAYTMIWLD